MTLDELRILLQAYSDGRLADTDFDARLTEVLVNETPELALPGGPLDDDPAALLLSHLIFQFQQRELASRTVRSEAPAIAAALLSLEPRATLAVLPLFWQRERMAEIIEKHRNGVISRTGFVGAVSAASLGDRTSQWILSADSTALEELSKCLRQVDLAALHQLTERAAA
jgi:hypothetical protein